MNQVVLSGTRTLVPSGTRSSCYRGPKSLSSPCGTTASGARNFPNLESFGFLLTHHATAPPLTRSKVQRLDARFTASHYGALSTSHRALQEREAPQ